MTSTLDDLRRRAVARSFFAPTTLQRALNALGFVQADPIRAPARAQDLMLRHRVAGYRAGDLERLYARLDVHEDFFINYGFVTADVQALMHPRSGRWPWTAARGKHVRALLDFVRNHGSVHPREVDEHFSHGTVTNYWGGSPARPRTCSATCTTADCCESSAARLGFGSTLHTSMGPARAIGPRATRVSTPLSMSPFATTRRCRRRASQAW